ncbi:MAG: hypothetical protein AB7S26_02445 [Sandaracinaceae bacterium]
MFGKLRGRIARSVLAAVLFGCLLGCEPTVPEGKFACIVDTDCPPDMVCRVPPGRCYLTREPTDGG